MIGQINTEDAYVLPLLVFGALILIAGVVLVARREAAAWVRYGMTLVGALLLAAAFVIPATR